MRIELLCAHCTTLECGGPAPLCYSGTGVRFVARVVVGGFRYNKAAAGRRTTKSDLGVDSDLHTLQYLKILFGKFESSIVAFGFVVAGVRS